MNALLTKSRKVKIYLMKGIGITLALLLLIATGFTKEQNAFADEYLADIESVSDDEFAPFGYNWSLNFTGVTDESGWTYTDNLSQYYRLDCIGTTQDPNLVNAGDTGYMIAIDSSTVPAEQTLRFTGGTYDGIAVDALVKIADWTYLEPLNGLGWQDWWENSRSWLAPFSGDMIIENFTPGIYYNPTWNPEGIVTNEICNFNFFTVGLCDLEVEVIFCRAGTSTPLDVSGHITCIDLDVDQKFAFGGAINLAQVSQESLESGHLSIDRENSQVVSSSLSIGDALSDPNYKLGLVGCYFDYMASNDPIKLKFVTSYNGADSTAISFFAVTNEYMTAANPLEETGSITTEKTADVTTDLLPGDIVTFTVDAEVHTRGVNCRSDWYYTSFEITDLLPAEMAYIDNSGYLTNTSGQIIEDAGTIAYDSETNTVTFAFDASYLQNIMPMNGEHYLFTFQAEIMNYPADNVLTLTNNAYSCVNSTDTFPAPPLDLNLIQPAIAIEKHVEETSVQAGSDAAYTVVVTNTAASTAFNVTVTDVLPEELYYVENSLSSDTENAIVSASNNTISATLDTLAPSESLTITYRATVIAYEQPTIINTAYASADNTQEVSDSAEITPLWNVLPEAGGVGTTAFALTGTTLLGAALVLIGRKTISAAHKTRR